MHSGESTPPRFVIPDVGNIDLSKIRPKYGSPSKGSEPDYIPYNARGKDIFSRLSSNTGYFWLGGFCGGGAMGFVEGWREAASPHWKVRFNSVMNGISRRGGKLGNALGAIAFTHTLLAWVIGEVSPIESWTTNTSVTPITSGFATGFLYKSTTGIRGALLAGCIGAVGSCGYWYGTSYLYNVILKKGGRF